MKRMECPTTQRRRRLSARLASGQPPAPSTDDILSKTNYDQSTHPAESTDWLNVLFAQVRVASLAARCCSFLLTMNDAPHAASPGYRRLPVLVAGA